MSSVAERLRQERGSRKMTIEQIAKATGIEAGYLEALERGDFLALPGRAFGKLYIRAYAETLGFDPRELIEQYDEERAVLQAQTPQAPQPAQRSIRRIPAERRGLAMRPLMLGMGVVMALAISAGVYSLFFRSGAEAGTPASPAIKEAPAASAPAVTAAPAPPPPPRPSAPSVKKVTREAGIPAAVPANPLSVAEHGVGKRLQQRRLVDEEDRFARGEAALFFTRVVGGAPGRSIRHVWLHEGRVEQTITLRLGGPDWRTHSRKTLNLAGAWAVEARDEQGNVLARAGMLCQPPGDDRPPSR